MASAAPARTAQRQLALAVLEDFRVIFRSAKTHFQQIQDRTGVSGAQLWVLAEVHRQPGIRVTELARAMAVHQSTASNLVEVLVQSGHLKRARAQNDQRVVHLSLTAEGERVMAKAPQPVEGVLPAALRAMAPTELKALQEQLAVVIARMAVRDRRGRRTLLAEM